MLSAAGEAKGQLRNWPIVDLQLTAKDFGVANVRSKIVATGGQIQRLLDVGPVGHVDGAINRQAIAIEAILAAQFVGPERVESNCFGP